MTNLFGAFVTFYIAVLFCIGRLYFLLSRVDRRLNDLAVSLNGTDGALEQVSQEAEELNIGLRGEMARQSVTLLAGLGQAENLARRLCEFNILPPEAAIQIEDRLTVYDERLEVLDNRISKFEDVADPIIRNAAIERGLEIQTRIRAQRPQLAELTASRVEVLEKTVKELKLLILANQRTVG